MLRCVTLHVWPTPRLCSQCLRFVALPELSPIVPSPSPTSFSFFLFLIHAHVSLPSPPLPLLKPYSSTRPNLQPPVLSINSLLRYSLLPYLLSFTLSSIYYYPSLLLLLFFFFFTAINFYIYYVIVLILIGCKPRSPLASFYGASRKSFT